MKVLLKIAMALSLFLSSAAFVLDYAFSDSHRLDEIEVTKYSVPFYISETNVTTDDALVFFNKLSSTYNISIIKTSETMSDGKAFTVKSGIFSTETFPIDQFALISGTLPSANDEYIASYDSDDPLQSGVMYDFACDDRLSVQSLEKEYSQKGHVDGIYSIESNIPYDREVIAEISRFFSIHEDNLLKKTSFKAEGITGLFYIALASLGLLLLLTVLINAMTPITKLKLINSQKLLGWSNLSIWSDSVKGSVVFSIIVACLIMIACYSIPGWSRQFFTGLLFVQTITFVVMLTISTVSLCAIKRIKTAEALKGKSPFKLSLVCAMVLKVLFVICISASSVPIAQNGEIILKNYESKKHWVEYGNYHVISQFVMQDDDINSLLTGDPKLSDRFAALYDDLNEELGAMYTRSTDYPEYSGLNTFSETYQTLVVNPNYLNRYPILDLNGNQFNFSESEKSIIILIPKSREEEAEKFVEQAKSNWEFDETSANNRYGYVDDSLKENVPEVIFNIYDDTNKLFSFNNQVAIDEDYLLESPLIEVVTMQNIQQSEKWNIQTIRLSAPLKIPDLSEDGKSKFYEIISRHGFSKNSIYIDSLINCIASEIAQSQNSMTNLLFVFVVLFLLCAVSSFALIHIVLISRKQWLDVARYLGYTLLSRHWQVVLFIAGTYILCAVAIGMISGSALPCAIILCASFLDLAICTLVVWRLEKKSTALLLKGQ